MIIRPREKLVQRIILAAILGLCSLSVAAQAPNDVVSEAADLLDAALKDRKEELAADKDSLYTLIDGILMPRFDREFAAKQVLREYWKSADPGQRERYVNAFYQSLVRRYAEGVLEFDQSRIDILPFRGDLSKRYVTVKTIVRLDDGTKVPVHYEMKKNESGWMIFDVIIEGISYIRTFRAEMKAEIQRSSLDAVIERLESEVGGVNADE